MRRLGILLHIGQSPVQHEKVFRDIANTCYVPLIRLIKNKKVSLSMNIPLSLLEQMDKYGYKEWLKDVRELVMSERLELVGSGAYHPLLTKIPEEYAAKQVILNEYALGYYFGKRGGFEGDPSIMIRNLAGFFPPELAVNEGTLKLADELGYEWVLVDESSIPKEVGETKYGLYKVGSHETLVVSRYNKLSNSIEGKKNLNTNKIVDLAIQAEESVVSFNGEVFGHHFDQGVILFENILSSLKKKGVDVVTVSDYIRTKDEKEISSINEGTWEISSQKEVVGDLYSRWDAGGNQIHKNQWEIINKVLKVYKPPVLNTPLLGMEEVPIWLESELSKMEDEELRDYLELDLLISKAAHSYQFLWASYDPLTNSDLILSSNVLWEQVTSEVGDKKLIAYVLPRLEKIAKLVEKAEIT